MAKQTRLRRHEVKELIGVKTDAERIIEYLQSDVDDINARMELPAHVQEKLERITTAKALLMQHKFVNKVQRMLKKHYKYSDASAIRDLGLMNKVFGPLLQVTKDLKKVVAEEMIRQDRDMALQQRDIKALTTTTANYIKLHALDVPDNEMPDLSHFEFHQNIIAVLPEQVGVDPASEDELLKKLKPWIIDVDHEEGQDT